VLIKVGFPDLGAAALLAACRQEFQAESVNDLREDVFNAAFSGSTSTNVSSARRAEIGEALAWLITHRLHPRHLPAITNDKLVTEASAAAAVERLYQVWPCVGTYYRESLYDRLAHNLGVTTQRVRDELPEQNARLIHEILAGQRSNPATLGTLARISTKACYQNGLEPSQELCRRLVSSDIRTPNGRLRGRAIFGDTTNPVVDLIDDLLKYTAFTAIVTSSSIPVAATRDSLLLLAPRLRAEPTCEQLSDLARLAGQVILKQRLLIQTTVLPNFASQD